MRVQVDDARAVWRVLISPDGGHHSHVFDVEIGGQTYTKGIGTHSFSRFSSGVVSVN